METMPDDAELLRRYVEDRSEEAFTALVERHLNLVYRAALRQAAGDSHRAQDVAQRVFTLMARKAAALVRHTQLTGWLYTTTHHVMSEIARTERRRRKRENEALASHEMLLSDDDAADWSRVRPVLDEALQELQRVDREAVLLRFFEGCSFADIGRKLDLGEDAVRMRCTRALEKLWGLLAKRGITSSTAALAAMLASEAAVAAPAGLATTVAGGAFATTGGGTPAVVTLLQFMNTTKFVAASAMIGGLLMSGLSIREYRAARAVRAELAAATLEDEAAFQKLSELRKRSATADRELTDLQAEAARLQTRLRQASATAAAARNQSAASGGTGKNAAPGLNRELSNDPRVREELGKAFNPMWAARYGPLFQDLGLTPAQIEAEEKLRSQGTSLSTQWGEVSMKSDEFAPGEEEQAERNIIGDSGLKQLRSYDQTAGLREVASGLAGNLYNTDAPLSAAQAEQLTQILSRNTETDPNSFRDAKNVNWDATLAQAQGVLSPPQLAVLKNEAQLLSDQADSLITAFPGQIGASAEPPYGIFPSRGPN